MNTPTVPGILKNKTCTVVAKDEDGRWWRFPFTWGELTGEPAYLGTTRVDAIKAAREADTGVPIYVEGAL